MNSFQTARKPSPPTPRTFSVRFEPCCDVFHHRFYGCHYDRFKMEALEKDCNGDGWRVLITDDGIGGICDDQQRLCLAIALWNEQDPILKERLFALTGNQGNHGEDVKHYFLYLDATPSHSFLKYLYKYPQSEFPYSLLVEENSRRTRRDPAISLLNRKNGNLKTSTRRFTL